MSSTVKFEGHVSVKRPILDSLMIHNFHTLSKASIFNNTFKEADLPASLSADAVTTPQTYAHENQAEYSTCQDLSTENKALKKEIRATSKDNLSHYDSFSLDNTAQAHNAPTVFGDQNYSVDDFTEDSDDDDDDNEEPENDDDPSWTPEK
ncbi:unnamed protein product [Porites evermanni]|uniref:Uncharacterized protein n=1 Tax=Porites evermanni TaxID=104178 RepID=A0ABN8M9Z4_9CNID|nr:unnamed protein product [Porites evermanni]